MSTAGLDERTDARRLVEASAWRTHFAENDIESTPAFEAWLADSRNRDAWQSVQRSWDLFGEHASSPELLDLRRRALGKARAMGRERWAARHSWVSRSRWAAIAAALLVAVFGAGVTFYVTAPDTYQTVAGERRVVTLADGSRVQLDSSTTLSVDYSKRARELKLIEGQAHFDVAHDVERPFSVLAAGRKVVATGTAFNVDLLGAQLFVTLIEGKVVVLPRDPRARVLSAELQAGQQLAVLEDGATIVAPASVKRATAWQSGQIVVENETLSSVAVRVNRYSGRPVNLRDAQIASLRISGVFNTGDVNGFVATITNYLPVKAEQGEDAIYLSARQ